MQIASDLRRLRIVAEIWFKAEVCSLVFQTGLLDTYANCQWSWETLRPVWKTSEQTYSIVGRTFMKSWTPIHWKLAYHHFAEPCVPSRSLLQAPLFLFGFRKLQNYCNSPFERLINSRNGRDALEKRYIFLLRTFSVHKMTIDCKGGS